MKKGDRQIKERSEMVEREPILRQTDRHSQRDTHIYRQTGKQLP